MVEGVPPAGGGVGAAALAPGPRYARDTVATPRQLMALGLVMSGLGLASLVAMFYVGQGITSFEKKVKISTDFSTITGLRPGSIVQVAGVVIGDVYSIDFYDTSYDCDPMVEDYGRSGDGRRDDCEPQLFCSPEGNCARVERWISDVAAHAPCVTHADCGQGSVCVTKPFRRRNVGVYWAGEDNLCARFSTTHNRVRVTMEVTEDKLSLLAEDSRAKVSTNSMLGDQLVEITRGSGTPL
jgi:hypothetical protein